MVVLSKSEDNISILNHTIEYEFETFQRVF